MRLFNFKPNVPITRSFNLLADFREQAKENGWDKRATKTAIKESTSDGETLFEVAVKLSKCAGLDNNGKVMQK